MKLLKQVSKKAGVALTVAAAALLATGCTSLCGDSAEEAPCNAHDSCKGSSSCKMPSNSCKGKKAHHHHHHNGAAKAEHK